MIAQEKIKEAVQRLINTYKPLKIYIFGSYAWGKPTEDSDLDFLVIIKESSEIRPKRAIKGHMALIGLEIPKDIIIYTESEFDSYAKDKLTLSYKIEKEGKLVYEA